MLTQSSPTPAAEGAPTVVRPATDPVGLSWLVTVRWTTLVAGAGAVVAGRNALDVAMPITTATALLAAFAISNLWLTWRVRVGRTTATLNVAGVFICADVALLSWLLLRSGGVLNPASVFYLVQIVVAALVLGRRWTWIVTALSVGGYAALFLAPTDDLRAAQIMHPEIALHMRGMWLAFALTALIIAVLVARLAMAVERRDQALETLRDRTARTARAASLATLAAGAAHELSTPLSTIAVAAHELERTLTDRRTDPDLQQDARLIRAETERCRQILDAMAATSGNPAGETPRSVSIADIVAGLRVRLNPAETDRVRIDAGPSDAGVLWPVNIVTRALANIVQNALQASAAAVEVEFRAVPEDSIQITVVDRGAGMSAEDLGRAGDPFFTTKPPGRGTGLGLFVARSSIEQLGGRLSLSSRPGHGTSAVIILPVNVVLPVASDHE